MKTIRTHLSTENAKNYKSNLALERYVNWLPFKCRSSKIFFHALAFLVSEILPINSVPGKQSIVNNFWHSLLSASWDPSFESPGGVLFQNVYFYCVKVVSFPVRESDHISNIKKEVFELTLVLKMPKN